MRRGLFTLVLVFLASVVTRSSGLISLRSWDGTPPGTLEQITGLTYRSWDEDLPAGTYLIHLDGRHTAFADDALDQPTDRVVTFARPWHLTAYSRDLGPVTRRQFVISDPPPGTAFVWHWGFEDLDLAKWSDADYQDLYGTITHIPEGGAR